MDIQDIAKSREKKAIFNMVLEETCRQWCCFIDEAPERKDGEGFADFFYEIFDEKEKEFIQQVREMNGGRLPSFQPNERER